MSFLDTEPASIDNQDFAGSWDRFYIEDPRRKRATLRELCRADVPLTLGRAGAPTLAVTVWSVDEMRERLHLHLQSGDVGAWSPNWPNKAACGRPVTCTAPRSSSMCAH
jgi:hypothetical protein